MAHNYDFYMTYLSKGCFFLGNTGLGKEQIWLFICRYSDHKSFINGNMTGNLTPIDDVIAGIKRFLENQPVEENDNKACKISNFGDGYQKHFKDFIKTIKSVLSSMARKKILPLMAGDILSNLGGYFRNRKVKLNEYY